MGKRPLRFVFLSLVLALLVSGCWRFGVDELRHTEPQGTPFQNALAAIYLEFAEAETDQHDWPDADYFARKGVKAAQGQDVVPENPADWEIPETMLKSMQEARTLLLNTVNMRTREIEPENAARAFFLYDCWVEQQEENWQLEHIESCRNEFFEMIDYLSVAVNEVMDDIIALEIDPDDFEKVERSQGAAALEQALLQREKGENAPEGPFMTKKSSYVIFFGFDSTDINRSGEAIIARVIEDLGKFPQYLIRINGHADSAGNALYNEMLSRQRAEKVKGALINKGADEKAIEVQAYGEERQRQETPDGIAEPANRVVEIYLH